MSVTQEGGSYVAASVISGSMMKRVVETLESEQPAIFVIGGKGYWLPTAGFKSTVTDLKACERHRIGMVLGD